MNIYEYHFYSKKIPNQLQSIRSNYNSIGTNYHKYIYYDIIDLNESKIYVLKNNNENVAYAFMFKIKDKMMQFFNFKKTTYVIRDVFVFPEHRRKGYCKKLMNWINKKYQDKFMFLEVNETNENALRCYSFLKPYNNQKLESIYDKYHYELKSKFYNYTQYQKNWYLKNYPHMLSKYKLFSN